MKSKKRMLAVMGLAFGLLLMFSLSANASIVYSGNWFATDNTSNASVAAVNVSGLSLGQSFYVYDPVAGINPVDDLFLVTSGDADKFFYVTDTVLSLDAAGDTSGVEGTSWISITDGEFAFYFNDTVTDVTTYNITAVGAGDPIDTWDLDYTHGVDGFQEVRVEDVSPVPIPSAILLLGSGLMGLVGFRRKFQG